MVQRAFASTAATENAGYVERMYQAWKQDPRSVHISWNEYFKGAVAGTGATAMPASAKDIADHVKVMQMINAYQLKGHEMADLDPLCILPLVTLPP
ncbi:MAG: hypothetical protein P4L10_17545 [Acidobacteriaceae bacterium]|nr:hypothetical protein [Acidobacteriaceae bacterium]